MRCPVALVCTFVISSRYGATSAKTSASALALPKRQMVSLDFVEMSSPAFTKGVNEEEKPFQSPAKPSWAKRERVEPRV
jgi:hypothetical protein